MIGSGLKKLAKENGMTVYGGVAYGDLRGFSATLSEGAGYKTIVFSTRFTDPAKKDEMMQRVEQTNIRQQFRVQNLGISSRTIQVVFHDNPGTMKLIYNFLDWFIPMLQEAGATGSNICPECGGTLTAGKWVQVGSVCHHFHESCAEKVRTEIDDSNEDRKAQDNGNYFTGTIGALLGASIGAVLWAIVLNAGYVASLVGLVIGWLAEKGYNLLKGKQGKAKILILILVLVLAVVLGTLGADGMYIVKMMNQGRLPGFTLADVPMFIIALLAEDAAYRSATLSNIGTGLLFAGLGVFFLLRNASAQVSGTKFRYMK